MRNFAGNQSDEMLRLLTIFTLLFAAFALRCEPKSPATVSLYYQPEESGSADDDTERPKHGHRMPPAPIPCTIDFESQSIISNSPMLDAIVEYRLMDSDGFTVLCDFSQQSFVGELAQITTGHYILLLVADNYQLSGTINP